VRRTAVPGAKPQGLAESGKSALERVVSQFELALAFFGVRLVGTAFRGRGGVSINERQAILTVNYSDIIPISRMIDWSRR